MTVTTPGAAGPDAGQAVPAPLVPDYGGACIANLVPALFGRAADDAPGWLPEAARQADQVVLLVLDGLGWEQLRERAGLAPTLSGAPGMERPLTSVAPTTTACALTSITTGQPPSRHGLLGYRLCVDGEILNALRWTLGQRPPRDARRSVPARSFQTCPPFPGSSSRVPVVSRDGFGGTGFTAAHLGDSPLVSYLVPSSLPVEVARQVEAGAPFVYAYYDGLDRVAHGTGLGERYEAELRAADRLVAEVAAALPDGAVLVVTADHGQIDVGPRVEVLGAELMAAVELFSGEGRFRWLHARAGAADDLAAGAAERYGDTTWVRTRQQLVDEGVFGGPLPAAHAGRLGDVALIPHAPLAFADPADTGENRLRSRHGSLTPAEVLVPLLALSRGDVT